MALICLTYNADALLTQYYCDFRLLESLVVLHAVIMAGGSGTRFWPASRVDYPKQLLRMVWQRNHAAINLYAAGWVGFTRTHADYDQQQLVKAVCEQLPAVPPEQVIGEPMKRDTAACIGLAASLILNADPNGIMLVLPADHVIKTQAQFQDCMRNGMRLIEQSPDRIVTFGIRPTYAAESFGYIQRGQSLKDAHAGAAFTVASFREKPNRHTAEQYLQAGTYYWNSGIFMWRAKRFWTLCASSNRR